MRNYLKPYSFAIGVVLGITGRLHAEAEGIRQDSPAGISTQVLPDVDCEGGDAYRPTPNICEFGLKLRRDPRTCEVKCVSNEIDSGRSSGRTPNNKGATGKHSEIAMVSAGNSIALGRAGLDAVFDNYREKGMATVDAVMIPTNESRPSDTQTIRRVAYALASADSDACADLVDKAARLRTAAQECDDAVRNGELSSCMVDLVTFRLAGVPKEITPGNARALAGKLESVARYGDDSSCEGREEGGEGTIPQPQRPGNETTHDAPRDPTAGLKDQIGVAFQFLEKSESGQVVADFLRQHGIRYAFKDFNNIDVAAQYSAKDGMIYINSERDVPPVELAAMIGHEGLHVEQVLVAKPSIQSTIESEQDANLIECIIYHEMLQAGVPRLPSDNSVEWLYSRVFVPAIKANNIKVFNNFITEGYKKPDPPYETIAEMRADAEMRAGHPVQQPYLDNTAVEHQRRQTLILGWMANHSEEIK